MCALVNGITWKQNCFLNLRNWNFGIAVAVFIGNKIIPFHHLRRCVIFQTKMDSNAWFFELIDAINKQEHRHPGPGPRAKSSTAMRRAAELKTAKMPGMLVFFPDLIMISLVCSRSIMLWPDPHCTPFANRFKILEHAACASDMRILIIP